MYFFALRLPILTSNHMVSWQHVEEGEVVDRGVGCVSAAICARVGDTSVHDHTTWSIRTSKTIFSPLQQQSCPNLCCCQHRASPSRCWCCMRADQWSGEVWIHIHGACAFISSTNILLWSTKRNTPTRRGLIFFHFCLRLAAMVDVVVVVSESRVLFGRFCKNSSYLAHVHEELLLLYLRQGPTTGERLRIAWRTIVRLLLIFEKSTCTWKLNQFELGIRPS